MHELAICESVLRQVLAVTASRHQPQIGRITLRLGPLAGVEPDLVRFAFPLVAAGTTCAGAVITIETAPVQVRCQTCQAISDVPPNCLLCTSCGAWRVSVLCGDEMTLASVELIDASLHGNKDGLDV